MRVAGQSAAGFTPIGRDSDSHRRQSPGEAGAARPSDAARPLEGTAATDVDTVLLSERHHPRVLPSHPPNPSPVHPTPFFHGLRSADTR